MSLEDSFDDDDLKKSGYPDWWEPEKDGERLVGYVRDIRRNPFGDDGIVLEVETEDGAEYSTKTHVQLQALIKDFEVEIGDVVLIQFEGTFSTKNGKGFDYSMAVKKP